MTKQGFLGLLHYFKLIKPDGSEHGAQRNKTNSRAIGTEELRVLLFKKQKI